MTQANYPPLIAFLWLALGLMAVRFKLRQLGVLPSTITWRDAFALVLLVLFWPILVVF